MVALRIYDSYQNHEFIWWNLPFNDPQDSSCLTFKTETRLGCIPAGIEPNTLLMLGLKHIRRRKGKGRHCSLRDGIDSIPCRNRCFPPGWFWRKGWIEKRLLGGMDALKKWMIIRFTPHQTTTLPKWMFSQKPFFKSTLLLNGYCGIQVYVPQTTAATFALSSVFILLLWDAYILLGIFFKHPALSGDYLGFSGP